jgi:hypothetical protein
VSALTFSSSPFFVAPIQATTGTYPALRRSRSKSGFEPATGTPTNPIHRVAGHRRDGRGALDDGDRRICTCESHRAPSCSAYGRDEPRIDCAGEHSHHDIERGRVGHAKAIDLPLRNTCGRQGSVDFPTSAVHHDQRRLLGEGHKAFGHT